jgi:hypothetical protein
LGKVIQGFFLTFDFRGQGRSHWEKQRNLTEFGKIIYIFKNSFLIPYFTIKLTKLIYLLISVNFNFKNHEIIKMETMKYYSIEKND